MSKSGRNKRTRSKFPVVKHLRKQTPTCRRKREHSPPITSARTVSKTGRRRTTHPASGATHAVSDNEAEKSDGEPDDDDNTEQESSSDGAEESLTLADVKKGLCVKDKLAGAAPGIEDAVPATVAPTKSNCSRTTTTDNEKLASIDATAIGSDVSSSGGTTVITTNIDNSEEEKKVLDTKCTDLLDAGLTIESRVIRVSADEEEPANVPSIKLTAESLDISNETVRTDATISDELTSLVGDGGNFPILETESGKGAPVENGIASKPPPPSAEVSSHEDDVTSAEAKQSTQIDANDVDKSPSAIGCCALEEQVIGAAAAAPQTNTTAKETEPVSGKTAIAPLAAIPTPDDDDSSIDTEDEYALGLANLPGEERNIEDALAKEQSQADDITEQDIAEQASSENRVEILR